MTETKLTPQEIVLQDIQTQHPGDRLIAKNLGPDRLVIFRLPTPEEVDSWQDSKDSRRKANDDLLLATALYPAKDVLAGYFKDTPAVGSNLVLFLSAAAVGSPEKESPDVRGYPTELGDQALLAMGPKALGRDPWMVETEMGKITLRCASGTDLDAFTASRLNARRRSEGFVLGCLLHPQTEVVQTWFLQRPLMGLWLSRKLQGWAEGTIEDLHSK